LLNIIVPRIVNTYFFIISSEQENAASSDDSAEYDFEEWDVCKILILVLLARFLSQVKRRQTLKKKKLKSKEMLELHLWTHSMLLL
jgi:hypothetical protein